MKKSWLVLLVLILAAALFLVPGCDKDEGTPASENGEGTETEENGGTGEEEGKEEESAWEIKIIGPDGKEAVVTLEEIMKMEAVELEAESKRGPSTFKGVLLSKVLEKAGITEANEVTLTAADGYGAAISGEIAFSENTILAYERDGEDMSGDEKNGPIRLVTTEETSNVWVGKISTIEVK